MEYEHTHNTAELTIELTRDALGHIDGDLARAYEPHRTYGNPLADSIVGQPHNWDKNLVPANTVRAIRAHDELAEGVANVARAAIDALMAYSDGKADISGEGIIGLVETLASRFGVGASGERFVLENTDGEPVEREGDETRGVDIRYKDGRAIQVKTADSRRYNWGGKEETMVIWVEPGARWKMTEL